MATVALVVGILSSLFSIGHTAYLLEYDVTRPAGAVPAMHAPASDHRRMLLDMTPLATNRSLGGH